MVASTFTLHGLTAVAITPVLSETDTCTDFTDLVFA